MSGIHKLTTGQAEAATRKRVEKPKVISDGGGLYLRLRPGGVASWFFAATRGGRRRELGLGSAAVVTLSRAREKADAARRAIVEGRDPFEIEAAAKAEKKAQGTRRIETAAAVTFGAFAEEYVSSIEAGFRNPKHRQQWRNTLRDHGAPLRNKLIADVGTDDVLDVLRPIWLTKPETASRLRGRIEKVLNAAKAKGLRPRDSFNPASWRGHLDLLLPKQTKLSRGHHAALPFSDVPGFIATLRTRPALAARALEFTILTAARTGETIGALWEEVDFDKATWSVPASRMKAGAEHTVPLSPAAIAILEAVRPQSFDGGAFIFTNGRRPLSNMSMAMLLRRLGRGDVTVHGFRSTFRDWAGDATDFPRELVEQALAHTIESKAERAYRRGTAVERRRGLMVAWADYLAPAPVVEALDATDAARPAAGAPEPPAKPSRTRQKVNPYQTALEV